MADILKLLYRLKKLYAQLCRETMDMYDLTRSELDILLFLYNHPEYDKAKDLVIHRSITKSHVSSGIDRLVEKGLIKSVQDVHDRRVFHLILMEDSKKIIEDGLRIRDKFNEILFSNISEEEKELFKKIIDQIYENCEVNV